MKHRIPRVALAALLSAAVACGSESTRVAGPPATIAVVTAPTASVTVGTSAGIFAVKVSDSDGLPVSGARVGFVATGGGTASPAADTTDAAGLAQTSVNAGSIAGPITIVATVTGTAIHADAAVTAVAGPLTRLVLAPELVRLNAVGETATLTVSGLDALGNSVATGPVTFTSRDQTVATVNSAGVVTAMKLDASTSVIASNGTRADTSTVSVVGPNSSACIGLAQPRTLAVGESVIYQGVSSACLTGTPAGAEFALVAYNGDTTGIRTTTLSASGVGTAPTTVRIAPTAALSYVGGPTAARALQPDLNFHRRLGQQTRALAGRFPAARQWQRSARTKRGASYATIGTNPTVGQVIKLNVNGNDACTNVDLRAVRIVAVGTRSVVMADTLNPAGGFTTADYNRYAAAFDTLVYPLDVGNFGAPTDIDHNGKVGILFTKAVNELTSANSNSYVGGFFFGRDLFPTATTPEFGPGCAGSNEGEMFYMLAPDPTGAVNGNVRTRGLVDTLTTGTIAHEFQHLINSSRRIYVNNADDYEITWLDEGLSHIAEELLYYRQSGKTPRQNLGDPDIRPAGNTAIYNLWKQDAAQNFQRFASYLADPAGNSPAIEDDELATRGATWSFLRYAADRLYTTDGDVWLKLVNSTTRGFGTLRLAFGSDQVSLIRDWTVANYADDLGIPVSTAYEHQSWNYRSIFTNTFTTRRYPLPVTGLADGASTTVSVTQSSAGYFRLAVPANGEALVRLAAAGSAPAATFQFVVVRTR